MSDNVIKQVADGFEVAELDNTVQLALNLGDRWASVEMSAEVAMLPADELYEAGLTRMSEPSA